jgi:imidazolonepropionase-like amidohydrolase
MKPVALPFFLFLALSSCQHKQPADSSYTAFIGATIIDGTGSDPVENGVLLVQNGRVVKVGRRQEVAIPDGATIKEVEGKFIAPGIINGHGHVGNTKGIEGGHYSTENINDNLRIYARYGVTTVVSLGDDGPEAVPLRAVNDTSSVPRARLFIAGKVITGKTPEEAMAVIDSNDSMGVDFMKIRVDDNLGASSKMTEDVYRAVITYAHQKGYKIATHMYYLDDARKLLEAGTDLLAHSVRDLPVDQAFIQLLKAKKIGYCPTLTRELSTFVYGDTAEFFTDPFFAREYDSTVFAPLNDPARQMQVANNQSAQTYKRQLPTALANLKRLTDEGIPIVFGTDSGVPTRFMGYFEHLELSMMAEAGMTPMQIIVSTSKNPAEYLGLNDLGTLSPGHWADFLILNADPLENITNMKTITEIYIGGVLVE